MEKDKQSTLTRYLHVLALRDLHVNTWGLCSTKSGGLLVGAGPNFTRNLVPSKVSMHQHVMSPEKQFNEHGHIFKH